MGDLLPLPYRGSSVVASGDVRLRLGTADPVLWGVGNFPALLYSFCWIVMFRIGVRTSGRCSRAGCIVSCLHPRTLAYCRLVEMMFRIRVCGCCVGLGIL